MLPIAFKQLFIYLVPLNYFFGEYNLGAQYYLNEQWSLDVNAGYIYEYNGSPEDVLLNTIFNTDKILYQGPSVRFGIVSSYQAGINRLRTDFNKVEFIYRYAWYNNVDFVDEPDTGKVFNISEKMHVIGLSWIAGYEFLNKNKFRLDGFVGFGLQTRFRNRVINSYGYNFNSDTYSLNENSQLTTLVPMLNAGIRIGLNFTKNKKD